MLKRILPTPSCQPIWVKTSFQQSVLSEILPWVRNFPLDVKVGIAKHLDYFEIVWLQDTVPLRDQSCLWSHLSKPFEKVFAQQSPMLCSPSTTSSPVKQGLGSQIPMPLLPFGRLCREGLGAHVVNKLDVVTRQQAASCIAPECASTRLYTDLYVPWQTFYTNLLRCKQAVTSIALQSLDKNKEDDWKQLIPAVDLFEKHALCIDHYEQTQSGSETIIRMHASYFRALYSQWHEGRFVNDNESMVYNRRYLLGVSQVFDEYFPKILPTI